MKGNKVLLFIICCIYSFFAYSQVAGYSVEFDGKDDYIEIDEPLPIGETSFSVEMWLRVPKPVVGVLAPGERVGILFGNYSNNEKESFNFELFKNGRVRIYWHHGEIKPIGTKDLRDNQWHHIVFIRNKEQKKFMVYIDGELDLELDNPGMDMELKSCHRFGGDRRNATGGPSFHGQMDEIRIWKSPLTLEEIQKISKESVEYGSNLYNNILLYYECEPGRVKSQVNDSVGSHHGKFVNF